MRWSQIMESAAPPVVAFKKLFHVGSMDIAHKRKDSHEGAGLSVSLHPEEWKQIAKGFVDGDLWTVTKNGGGRFLDYHSLTKHHKKDMLDWGIANQFVEPRAVFRMSYYDEEYEETCYFDCDSLEEAEFEATEYEDAKIKKLRKGFVMTPKLQARCNLSGSHYMNCYDFLSTVYADDVLGLDGVWWDDTLSVSQLSAPRGVIFPSRVSSFKITS